MTTITQISKNLWLIREEDYSEHCNCFLLRGSDACALIDTGVGLITWGKVLPDLIQNRELLVFLTHYHFDHIGGACQFDKVHALPFPKNKDLGLAYLHQDDFINRGDFPFIESQFKNWQPSIVLPAIDKQMFHLGNYTLQVNLAPGHDTTSIMLFCPELNILFSGDTLYDGNLYFSLPDSNKQAYLNTLEKIKTINPKILCGGHNPPVFEEKLHTLANSAAILINQDLSPLR